MSAAKMSRNRQRKAAYAALANKSSRNQETLPGPVVGHFETVTHETRAKFGEDGEVLREYEVPVKPYQRIVHDDVPKDPTQRARRESTKAPGLASNPKKRRRQERAWQRCKVLRTEGTHTMARRNCGCCGCPSDIAKSAEVTQ